MYAEIADRDDLVNTTMTKWIPRWPNGYQDDRIDYWDDLMNQNDEIDSNPSISIKNFFKYAPKLRSIHPTIPYLSHASPNL